ncbi:metallopeptidase family M24-domain-containing protein [Hypoxylon sp. FL0890]|nr:metallopeptidase family M24-domain-containing protein [Hypoxylon sp. FL0890]
MDTMDHQKVRVTLRCRTKGLLQSAVSAAVAVVLSIPFISKLPLTNAVRSRSVEVNVAELEAKAEESPKRYPAKQHARKVAKELGTENGIIYLPGQLESTWEDSDQGPPFRQRRYFYYLTGADFPGCSVTYDIAADKLTLWVPFTPPATVLWFGNTPSPEDCLARSDVHDVKYVGELAAYLTSRLTTVKSLYALRPSQLPRFDGFEQLRSSIKIDVSSLQPAMDEARLIKSEYEVAMIRRANEISSAAHRKVATKVNSFKNECEVEAAFVAACTATNAKAQAYPVIAGSGPNASTLHYGANNEPLAGRQIVVLDAGAEWACYASEVSRSLPFGPRSKFTAEARAIYELVHKMQDECIQQIRPGVVFRDLQLHATLVAVKGLLELGVLRGGTAEEIFENGTGAAFFPHGVGHHVGLDVHELVSSSHPLFTSPPVPVKPVPFLCPQPRPPVFIPPSSCVRRSNNISSSVLSRDLLRPAGEGMWGKRRPIGPQSVRAMIKQAMKDELPSPRTSSSSGSQPTPPSTASPPLPPRSSPPPIPAAAPMTPQPSSPASSSSSSPTRGATKSPPPQPQRQNTLSQQQQKSIPRRQPTFSLSRQDTLSSQQGQNTTSSSTQQRSRGSQKNKRPLHNTLQPNMIVTVEPGIYFCRPYIEAYFLRREEYARYIDAAVLERYWAVGGVRVEDCVLVTETGYENLTTAPKGNDLLRMMGYA